MEGTLDMGGGGVDGDGGASQYLLNFILLQTCSG